MYTLYIILISCLLFSSWEIMEQGEDSPSVSISHKSHEKTIFSCVNRFFFPKKYGLFNVKFYTFAWFSHNVCMVI